MQFTLTIDEKTATVSPGATILDAANSVGARIPTLCHDNRLHPYGACRICMVEVEGPPRRMMTACTTPAANGMVVKTTSPAIIQARKDILELLLINHPLDCPVCDKAGECSLQDLVHEYGLGPGTFAEEKRRLPSDQDSAVIERNANRCILCGKCVRICKEQNAVNELTFTRRGGRSRISTAFDRPLDCEFCGECVEICPVGALGAKQFKYKARVWNLEQTPSTCIYCGCGCAVTLEASKGSVVRVRPARDNFLCIKGRFGWDAVHHGDRLTTPKMRMGGKLVDCTWDEALSVIVTNLNVMKNKHGAGSIGGLGSVRTTNEDNYIFQKFMRTVVGTNNVDLLARLKLPKGLNTVFFSGEFFRIGESDVILMLDKDTGDINPLTGIEIARAVNRRGSKLILSSSGHNKFNRIASVVIPQDTETTLVGLIAGLRSARRIVNIRIKQAVELLASAGSVAVILPSRLAPDTFSLVQELAGLLKQVAYYPLVMRGNIQGALDMGVLPDYFPGYQAVTPEAAALFAKRWNAALPKARGLNALEMLAGIEHGKLSALYIMGDDPVGSDPDFKADLGRLEFLVVQDIFLTETAKIARVVLPAASFLEKSGTFTNLERRLRRIAEAEEPLGEAKADWAIIQALAQRMGADMNYTSVGEIMKEIKSTVPLYKNLAVGACWPREQSSLYGTIADLSLSPDSMATGHTVMTREVITAGRLLFSSGGMISRSKQISAIISEEG